MSARSELASPAVANKSGTVSEERTGEREETVSARQRRELTVAVLGCAVAAGLALFAASRTWLVEVTQRPAPLPATEIARSGGSLVPALPALALVGLAGAGALLATRGRGRLAVGVLLAVSGLALAGTAIGAVVNLDGVAAGWPALAALAGAVVAVVGGVTVRSGRSWPALGTRYDRPAPRPAHDRRLARDQDQSGGMWDAIDRGEDPTKS